MEFTILISNMKAGVKNNAIKLTTMHEMTCRHAVYLSVALSLLATNNTAYFSLGLDFAINLFICLKIIWREKRKEVSNLHFQLPLIPMLFQKCLFASGRSRINVQVRNILKITIT